MNSSKLLGLPLLLLLSACGATPLAPRFAASTVQSDAKLAASLERAEARNERAVVVALRADAPTLCAWDLGGQLLWEAPVQAKSAPLVAGNAVVMQEREGITVRDLSSGKVRLQLSGSSGLVGADGVESAIVVSISHEQPDGSKAGELIYIAGDSIRWERSLPQPVGVPAIVNGKVLLPWGTQRLTVLSAEDGSELARWSFENMIVGQAVVDQGRVYVGQLGLLPVDAKLPERQAGKLNLIAPEKRALPGLPAVLRDGYAQVPAPDSASHKIKLEWHPDGNAQGVDTGAALFRFYRMVFGVSAQGDEVTWARSFERDLVGSAAHQGGTYIIDDHGTLRFVDGQGATHSKVALGKALRVATIRPSASGRPNGQPLESADGTLHDQLLAAAQHPDDRLMPARAFAVRHLAQTQDTTVTKELIALCSGATRLAAQQTACDELAKRETSPDEILVALKGKASFLESTAAPPVGALARAAARMKLKQAAPLLLSHLEDPHTSTTELVPLFEALAELDWQPALPHIERFVRLHHAEPQGSDLLPALNAAVTALGTLGAKSARPTLDAVVSDSLTSEVLKKGAKEAMAAIDAPPVQVEVKSAVAVAKAKQPAPAAEVQPDARPYALDAHAVEKAFRPLQSSIQKCLTQDPSQPKSVRITMIVAGSGNMEGFMVTPTSLQGCTDAILRTARFPETRLSRQHVRQTIYAEEPATTDPTPR